MTTRNTKAVLILAGCGLAYVLAGIGARVFWGPYANNLLLVAVLATAIPLLLILLFRTAPTPEAALKNPQSELAEALLHATSPMVLATSMEGRFTYLNPSAERLLGLRATELIGKGQMSEIFAPGELERIAQWLRKLQPKNATDAASPADPLRDYVNYILQFPPSQLRGIDLQLRRSDNSIFPATLYLSAVREPNGQPSGLLAVALDQTLTHRQERALRESRERYRDLFENANEMIATLSPAGQFVYVNPVWKSCFGLDEAAFHELDSLEMVFSPDCRAEVHRLFRLALDGEAVERAPIRTHTLDGRVLDLELSMSRRQKVGNPLAIRCLLRDITPQKQRERRLALQLVVSQIIGQSTSPEVAAMRILESVCLSQGWDAAMLWIADEEDEKLHFLLGLGGSGQAQRGDDPGEHGPSDWPRTGSAGAGVGAGARGVDGGSGEFGPTSKRVQAALRQRAGDAAGRCRCGWATG